MNPKSVAVTAAIALAVVLAHQHYATGGSRPSVKLSHG